MQHDILTYYVTNIIGIIGAICEMVWMASVLEAWLVDNDKTREFYGRHKALRNVQLGMCVFGCLYFLGMLFFGKVLG